MMLEGKDKTSCRFEQKNISTELNRPQGAHIAPSMSFKMPYHSDKLRSEMELAKNDSEFGSNSPHKVGGYRRYTYDVISDDELESKCQQDDSEIKLNDSINTQKIVYCIRPSPKNITVQTLYTEEGDGSIFIETDRQTNKKQLITVIDISTLYKEKRAKSVTLAKVFASISHKYIVYVNKLFISK